MAAGSSPVIPTQQNAAESLILAAFFVVSYICTTLIIWTQQRKKWGKITANKLHGNIEGIS